MSTTPAGPVCVSVMPPFSRHAKRRDWAGLDAFYNPGGVFSEVHIVSPDDDHPYDTVRFGSIVVHPIRPRPGLMRLGEGLSYALYEVALTTWVTLRVARRCHATVLWQRYASPLSHGLPCLLTALWLGRPCVLTLNNDYAEVERVSTRGPLRRRIDAALWRFSLARATAVVAVSDAIRGYVRRHRLDPEQVKTIPNKEFYHEKFGVPADAEEVLSLERGALSNLPDGAELVVTIARLVEQKNLPNQIDAFARAARSRPRLVLVLVGRGPLEEDVRRRIREAGIEGQVRLVPYLTHRALAALFQRSRVLLFATRFEGQGRVIVEAMAAGLPVIGSNQPPFTDMIEPERSGLLVDPASPEEIAEALVRIVDDDALRSEMVAHCTAVAERYEVDRVNQLERALFEQILGQETAHSRSEAGASRDPGADR